MVVLEHPLLFGLKRRQLCKLLLLHLLCMPLLQIEHMLGGCDLGGDVAARNGTLVSISDACRALRHSSGTILEYAISYFFLSVVEVLHVFVDVVLLADLSSERQAHFVSSIGTQRLGILVRSLNFMHCLSLFTAQKYEMMSECVIFLTLVCTYG